MNITFIIAIVFIILMFYLLVKYEYYYSEMIHKILYPRFYNNDNFKVPNVEQSLVRKGIDEIQNKKIIFCGLCRDIEDVMVKNIRWVESLGKNFSDYRIILFENDSRDRTRQIIKSMAKTNDKIELISCEHLGSKDCKLKEIKMYDYGPFSGKRIQKMAFFRNQYLERIKNKYQEYDYVMMMDFDIKGYFNRDGFYEVFGKKDDWDIIFANGRMPFIGPFDMMYDGLSYVDMEDNFFEYKTDKNQNQSFISMIPKLWRLQFLNEKWNPVKSLFNGCAIYKMNVIQNSKFNADYNCEWIGFHRNIYKNGHTKFFLSKAWKLYVGRQGPSI